MSNNFIPTDSRYIPFVQQPYCCGPACMQMVLYKNGLPLVAQEEIGAKLGLVVPQDVAEAFYNADVRDEPVVESGFGTRIQDPDYSLEKLIKDQKWPFRFHAELASKFSSQDAFINRLKDLVANDTDAFVCFQNDHGTGHICVLDIVDDAAVRVMDPSQQFPKWRSMSYDNLYSRVQLHGDTNYGGLWVFEKI